MYFDKKKEISKQQEEKKLDFCLVYTFMNILFYQNSSVNIVSESGGSDKHHRQDEGQTKDKGKIGWPLLYYVKRIKLVVWFCKFLQKLFLIFRQTKNKIYGYI